MKKCGCVPIQLKLGTLKVEFHITFPWHKILFFFWFFFPNHLKMQRPFLAYRPYRNRWQAISGRAVVHWLLIYTADCIHFSLIFYQKQHLCSVTHSINPRKDSLQSMGTFRFKLVQAIGGSCIHTANGWNNGSSLRGCFRIRKCWGNAGGLLHYSRGCHRRAQDWCEQRLIWPCDCIR